MDNGMHNEWKRNSYMKNVTRTLIGLAALVCALLATVSRAWAGTNDPQPCDAAALALVVKTSAAVIHDAPALASTTTTTVPNATVLVVHGHQADQAVGCWYQVQTLTGSLPAPAWIAGSTVEVSVRTDTSDSARPSNSLGSTASTVPIPTPTPYAPYNPANPYGVPLAPTPSAAPHRLGTPQAGTAGDRAEEPLVSRIVRSQVCLDANANTYCDVNEGVGGVPVYVVGAGGHVFAQTRTGGDGLISVLIQAPPRAQLTVNVPYLNAYERVSMSGDTAPILVPIGAALPGLLP